ncbi:HET domain containing protein [Hyaloscypha variabilis]
MPCRRTRARWRRLQKERRSEGQATVLSANHTRNPAGASYQDAIQSTDREPHKLLKINSNAITESHDSADEDAADSVRSEDQEITIQPHGSYLENATEAPSDHSSNGSRRQSSPDELYISGTTQDPFPGNCSTFIHPPYGSKVKYKGYYQDSTYHAGITFSKLAAGATACGFCSILYHAIQSQREKHLGLYIEVIFDYCIILRLKRADERYSDSFIQELELYTAPETPSNWAAFGALQTIKSNIVDRESLQQTARWIRECKLSHSACNQQDGGLPTRLLHISQDKETPKVRLEDTDQSLKYDYVALSHVWSLTTPLQTRMSDFPNYRQAVPWNGLSKGLQDAIVLTLSLGLSYIWIDALCIIQDSPLDWEAECPRMASIYNNAHVVFAAHGPELLSRKPPPVMKLHIPDPSRSWCMQEPLFATRILHFGGTWEETIFECDTHAICERGKLEAAAHFTTLKSVLRGAFLDPQPDALFSAYQRAICDYTSRRLTYPTDTLPAIYSFARNFSPYLSAYYARLWERDLISGLQWCSEDYEKCSRHQENVVPSFSWASRTGSIFWPWIPGRDECEFATVLDIKCTLATGDLFGKVSGGHITLRGRATEATSRLLKDEVSGDAIQAVTKGIDELREIEVAIDSIEDFRGAEVGIEVLCLEIIRDTRSKNRNFWKIYALVLRPVETSSFVVLRIRHFTFHILQELHLLILKPKRS